MEKTALETELEIKTVVGEIDLVKPEDSANIAKYKSELNLDDSTSVISWGTNAQKKVGEINAQMLEGVRSKDAGEVGAALVSMVTQMRGLDFGKAKGGNSVGFFGKLIGKIAPLAEFIQSFEEISSQITSVANKLEQNKVTLLKSVKSLDILYDATLEYFHELGNYVSAGEEVLNELDTVEIPKLKAAAASGELLDAQNLNDLIAKRDAFERRVHDIKLTRQVVMQSLPQIRMVQNNDNDLIRKIDTQIINTIPLWEGQLVVAIEQWKMREATKDSKAVSDFQNEMLVKNAEALKQGNAEARREIERGVYDIESIEKANELLIGTIEETIAISNEAKAKRAEAGLKLVDAEAKLKAALKSAA